MSLVLQNPKTMLLWDESYSLASGQDFSGLIGMGVAFTSSVTTGEATLSAPTSGCRIAGILKNNNAKYSSTANVRAEVCKLGMVAARALGAFSAGAELMVGDTYGRLTTATGNGSYVVAIAREAALEAEDMVAVEMTGPYKV